MVLTLFEDASDSLHGSGHDSHPAFPPQATSEKLMQKSPKARQHLWIILGPPAILLFDLVVPCIIYYSWYGVHRSQWERECEAYGASLDICPLERPEFDKHILGLAIISFGFGELYILIARVCRLLFHPKDCAPLLSNSRWELDATSWVYGVSMICALIPFVVSSTKEIPVLYLYSPAFLIGFLGVLMLITLVPFPIPIGIDSERRGLPLRPFIYYAAEDIIAVDCLQDREFRVRFNIRYEASIAFRNLFVHLTVWWLFGVCVYIGCLSAIIWTLEFHIAFGLSLGVLFSFLIIWGLVSCLWVRYAVRRQAKHERSTRGNTNV